MFSFFPLYFSRVLTLQISNFILKFYKLFSFNYFLSPSLTNTILKAYYPIFSKLLILVSNILTNVTTWLNRKFSTDANELKTTLAICKSGFILYCIILIVDIYPMCFGVYPCISNCFPNTSVL